MIYLASPYSHPDPTIREQRFHDACNATANLLRSGQIVFSPIVHGHPLVSHGLSTDWSFWEAFCREQIHHCSSLVVLMIDGWTESVGVHAEVRIAIEAGLSVRHLPAGAISNAETDLDCPGIVVAKSL